MLPFYNPMIQFQIEQSFNQTGMGLNSIPLTAEWGPMAVTVGGNGIASSTAGKVVKWASRLASSILDYPRGLISKLGDIWSGWRGTRVLGWTTWEGHIKQIYKGVEYALVEGKLFTKHAIERMMPSSLDSYGRSIPYSVVKSILDNPKSTEIVVIDGVERKLFYGEELIVVTEELGKIIVTVRYK